MDDPKEWPGKVFRPYGFADGRDTYVYEVNENIVVFGWQPKRGWSVFTTTVDNFRRDFEEKIAHTTTDE